VRRWRPLGLKELNVSFNDFHAEYLSLYRGEQNIVNAVHAAVEEGMRVAMAVTRSANTKINAAYVKALLGELAEEVIVMEDFISPTSKASSLYEETVENLPQRGGCVHAGTEISIHPNGDVAFCCGHVIVDPASSWFTRVGNIAKENLWDIVDRIRRNVLIWYINLISPHVLVKSWMRKSR